MDFTLSIKLLNSYIDDTVKILIRMTGMQLSFEVPYVKTEFNQFYAT